MKLEDRDCNEYHSLKCRCFNKEGQVVVLPTLWEAIWLYRDRNPSPRIGLGLSQWIARRLFP